MQQASAVKLTGQRYLRSPLYWICVPSLLSALLASEAFSIDLGRNDMASAIELIASGFVRVKDRAALERMREHRGRLLQECQMRSAGGFRSEVLETSLQDDVAALDAALSRLQTPAE